MHNSPIRTIYLYLFALTGLVLCIFGSVRFIDMGLRAFIFTAADEHERVMHLNPPTLYPVTLGRIEQLEEKAQNNAEVCLTQEEKIDIQNWLIAYRNWESRNMAISWFVARQHREASNNLAVILIGLPLFLYHWRIIQRETKNNV